MRVAKSFLKHGGQLVVLHQLARAYATLCRSRSRKTPGFFFAWLPVLDGSDDDLAASDGGMLSKANDSLWSLGAWRSVAASAASKAAWAESC